MCVDDEVGVMLEAEMYYHMKSQAVVRMCCAADMGRWKDLRDAPLASSLIGSGQLSPEKWAASGCCSCLSRLRLGPHVALVSRRCILDLDGGWSGDDRVAS
jgi:hypothetical protein